MKPLHSLVKCPLTKLLPVVIMACLAACTPKTSPYSSPYVAAQGTQDSFANDDPVGNVPMADTESPEPQTYYCSSPVSDPHDLRGKSLIGKVIPDLEDSLLLGFVYGNSTLTSNGLATDAGSETMEESESPSMEVAEQLGNDSMQLVYLRASKSVADISHNYFQETCLMLKRNPKGWQVLDAYVDAESIDFAAVDVVGEYKGSFILRYETSGVYGGGISYGSHQYRWLNPNRLQGPSIEFMVESSNGASMQCISEEGVPDYHCDCYARSGTVKFNYNKALDCLVFNYHYENQLGDCEMKNARTATAEQIWYMNGDTAFQAKGPILGEWGDGITGKVNLSKAEIQRVLSGK